MPKVSLGIAAGECFAAMVFLFEIDHHLGTGNLGSRIDRIYVGYDKIRSLCLCLWVVISDHDEAPRVSHGQRVKQE